MNFNIAVPPDTPVDTYFTQNVLESVRGHLASGDFPGLQGLDLRIRLAIVHPERDTETWDIVIAPGAEPVIEYDSDGAPDAIIEMTEDDFRRTQFLEKRQLQFLRILQGNPRKFRRLPSMTGCTTLKLDTGRNGQITARFIFNQDESDRVEVRMSYDNFCNVLEGKKNMKFLFATRRIKHKGSLPLLIASGEILDPA